MVYKIEKNVKPPIRGSSFPLGEMNIGDSFLIKPADVLDSTRQAIFAAVHTFKKRSKNKEYKIVTKKMPDGGIRCWRIK